MPASKMIEMFTLKPESDFSIVQIAVSGKVAFAKQNYALLKFIIKKQH